MDAGRAVTSDLRIGPDLAPVDAAERQAFLSAAGCLDAWDCAPGFAGHSALWVRDRDLLVAQAAILELDPEADALRARLIPPHLPTRLRVARIDMMAVRPEYTGLGLEERLTRALIDRFATTIPRPSEALIFVGAACAPVLLSTLKGLPHVADVFE
ncbi:hypothetical protein [Jannaschia pohangensis]|uniref:Uncharacterized protein n=1 Tax=Jannaschia pohangensis TaxID=390807 RepID=A0A1I3UCW9_9RHOB|nr:hypothetical protein [Jannaschia pohangensis]SFJ80489.1 hypothetical protein SAMN04488095_3710 [Jannaschia pohangensis]